MKLDNTLYFLFQVRRKKLIRQALSDYISALKAEIALLRDKNDLTHYKSEITRTKKMIVAITNGIVKIETMMEK